MSQYLAEAWEFSTRKRLGQVTAAFTWFVIPTIRFYECVVETDRVVGVRNQLQRRRHHLFEMRVVAVFSRKLFELRVGLMPSYGIVHCGQVGFEFRLLSLLPDSLCVVLKHLVIESRFLLVVEVKRFRVWHFRAGVRLNAKLALRQQFYGVRQDA